MNDVYTWSKKGIKLITTYLSYSHLVVVMIVIIIMIMIIIIIIIIIIIRIWIVKLEHFCNMFRALLQQ